MVVLQRFLIPILELLLVWVSLSWSNLLCHLLILEVDRQWLPELFPEEETPQCLPTLLHLHLEDLLLHPAILRQWKIPFLLPLAEEWTSHLLILWLLHLVALRLCLFPEAKHLYQPILSDLP